MARIFPFGRKRRQREQHAEDGILAKIVPTFQAGRPLPSPHDFERLAREGYAENPLIHACIKEIARTAAEPDLLAQRVKRDGTVVELEDSHPLTKLLHTINEERSEFDFLEEFISDFGYAGNAFIHKVRSGAGRVGELWRLRPDRMNIVPGSDGRVLRYEYKVSDGKPQSLPPEDVVHMRTVNPLNDYWGLSPISVIARFADLDTSAGDYLRAFFANAGTPQGILKLKARVDPKERKRLKLLWQEEHQGVNKWHGLSVLDGDAEYKEIGTTPDKLRLDAVFDQTETRALMVYGIPPIIIGTRLGLLRSTLANYDNALWQFWNETLVPMYTRIGDKLTRGVAREFGEDLQIVFDLSRVEALQESQESLRRWALDGWKEGLLTRYRALQLVGEEPTEADRVYRIPNNATVETAPKPGRQGQSERPALALVAGDERRTEMQVGPAERHSMPAQSADYERAALSFELLASDAEKGTFKGVAAAYNVVVNAWPRTIFKPRAFAGSLRRDAKRFKILWQHDIGEPIGLPSFTDHQDGLEVEGRLSRTRRGADTIVLLEDKVITELSIGFTPLKWTMEKIDGEEEEVRVVTKAKLWEVSPVTWGANPGGKITEVNAVVTYQDLPLAPVTRAWDAGAARRRVRAWAGGDDTDWAKYRKAFVWYDSEEPEQVGSYKLPVADVIDGGLKAIPRAIFAAAAVLQGGRGGAAIPAADVPKCKAHLARYYKRLDRVAPWDRDEEVWAQLEDVLSLPQVSSTGVVRPGDLAEAAKDRQPPDEAGELVCSICSKPIAEGEGSAEDEEAGPVHAACLEESPAAGPEHAEGAAGEGEGEHDGRDDVPVETATLLDSVQARMHEIELEATARGISL